MSKKSIFMHYVNQPKAAPEPEWHTIFSGHLQMVNSKVTTKTVVSGLHDNIKAFRISGTYEPNKSASNSELYTYKDNGGKQTIASGKSQQTITDAICYCSSYSGEFLVLYGEQSVGAFERTCSLTYDATKGTITYSGTSESNSDRIYFNLNKIEALY